MKEALCKAFCSAMSVERVPSGFAITTPYSFDDGDPIVLYAITVRSGVYRLEDAGVQIPMLEASGVTIAQGTRGTAFEALLSEYDLEFDDDAMVVRSPATAEANVGAVALKLLAFLLRLQDFDLLTPEKVKQTWQEDALRSLHRRFDGVASVDEHVPIVPGIPGLPADAVIRFNSGGAPLAVFLGTSDAKGLEALVLKMELESYQHAPGNVVLLVERAKQNPLRERTYAMAQARLDDVLTYRGAEAESLMALARYEGGLQ